MPEFRYKAVSPEGRVTQGVREAETQGRLREVLGM